MMQQLESSSPPISLDNYLLLNAAASVELLRAEPSIEWPDGHAPESLRIERAWPDRRGGFSVEWSLKLDGSRVSLYAHQMSSAVPDDMPIEDHPTLTPQGLRGLFIPLPRAGLLIHSLDRDPSLPQMSHCLDGTAMREHLAPFWESAGNSDPLPDGPLDCQPVGYRAGRRATFLYHGETSARCAPALQETGNKKLVGKTFHDHRGEALLNKHARVQQMLATVSQGRVRVPEPVGYLPDLRMALFSWCPDHRGKIVGTDLAQTVAVSSDALADLHRVEVEDLPSYGIADELKVANRWLQAVYRVDDQWGSFASQLVDALHQRAPSATSTVRRTIHRDYYERQLTFTGDNITLLDLDTLAFGHPCLDWGNLLAHLILRVEASKGSLDDFVAFAVEGLNRYQRKAGALDRTALMYYWASSLYRIGAVHAFRCVTKVHTPLLWILAGRLLQTGFVIGASGGADHHRLNAFNLDPILEAVSS